MWFHNMHLSLYWIANQLCVWKIMVRKPNTQDTFPENANLHKTVWCEVGIKLEDIGTRNVRDDELNPRLEYSMVRLEHR